MLHFKLLIVLTACLSWSHCKLDRYCSVCEDHTMCKYHSSSRAVVLVISPPANHPLPENLAKAKKVIGIINSTSGPGVPEETVTVDIGKDCVNVGASGVTESEKREIIDVHNWLRRVVASGYETRGSGGAQPKAANLRKFSWDNELSKVAQRWADQCLFKHDTCRDDPRWKVGQNIYWKWKYPTHHVNWTEAIISWYNEVSLYNPNEVNSYRFEAATGHYTQMLWHDTHAIGCGRRDYGENKLYICNYGPAGNWLGEPLYDVGEPCSKCPQGTVCDEYLCALHKPEHKIESQAESKVVDNNALHQPAKAELTAKTINATHVETLNSPKENTKHVYASEDVKSKPQRTLNHTKHHMQIEDKHDQKVLTYVLLEIDDKTTANSIGGNDIELDSDTKQGIEEVKLGIENLVKSVIKKLRRKE